MTHKWITHRPPTEADADGDGDVKVPDGIDTVPPYGFYQHHTLIVPGQPWWSRKAAERAEVAAPAPAFAVGQQWRRRNGKVVAVTRISRDPATISPICADDSHWYRLNGASCTGNSQHDLIELVSSPDPQPAPPAPAPAPELTRKVVQIAAAENGVCALCDDGTVWSYCCDSWTQISTIPQPEA
jgi:hypothetical protein